MDIEAEFGLPLASITRIVKSRLPEGIQVGKEAKLAFSKARKSDVKKNDLQTFEIICKKT